MQASKGHHGATGRDLGPNSCDGLHRLFASLISLLGIVSKLVAMKPIVPARCHQFRGSVKEVAHIVGVTSASVDLGEPIRVSLTVDAGDTPPAEERHVATEGLDATGERRHVRE